MVGAIGMFAGSKLFTKASVADFYPSSCLGTWELPQNAQGAPETFPAGKTKISKENAAYYDGAITTEIFCGNFLPEGYEAQGDITSVALTLVWNIEGETTSTSEAANPEGESPAAGESTPEIVPATEEEIPTATQRSVTGNFFTLFRSRFFPNADAQEEPAPVPETVTPPPPVEEPTPAEDVFPEVVASPPPADENPSIPEEEVNVPPEETVTPPIEEPKEPEASSTEPVLEVPAPEPPPIVLPSPDESFLAIEYTLDGTTWFELAKVNPQNLPQLTLSLPVNVWDDLRNIQVRVRAIETSLNPVPRVFLDGMLIEIQYEIPPGATIEEATSLLPDGQSEAAIFNVRFDALTITEPTTLQEASSGSPQALVNPFTKLEEKRCVPLKNMTVIRSDTVYAYWEGDLTSAHSDFGGKAVEGVVDWGIDPTGNHGCGITIHATGTFHFLKVKNDPERITCSDNISYEECKIISQEEVDVEVNAGD